MAIDQIKLAASGLEFGALSAGHDADPLVVCLHGFPDSPLTFGRQFEPLVRAGHRVVAPTMRGYEPSSQPTDGDYSLMALADDVVGWLDALDAERAHLVGHDWGAAVAYVVAARHADRLLSATAMAVPPLARIPAAVRRVPRQLQRSWYMTFFQLRGVAERALVADDWRLLRRLWRDWSPDHTMSDLEWAELRAQFEQPGVVAAALGYCRHNATPPVLLGLRSTPAMEPLDTNVPMLVVHGENDGCMDRRMFDQAVREADFPAGIRRLEVPNAGHFVHLEQPDAVNSALVGHLAT